MIKNGLQDYELKMQEAAEKRNKVKQDQVDYTHTKNNRVVEKLEFKNIQTEELFRQQFEKNYEKRKRIEEKKKKLGEEKNQTYEYFQEQKKEKMYNIKAKQAQNKNIEEKKNKRLEIRWSEIKKRTADLSMRQPYALYESMVSKDNINSTNGRKHWIQQMNYQRKQRQQQDYKVLLVDKMQQKEGRVEQLKERQNQLIDYGQRLNHVMQENFYRTQNVTSTAALPQPFENHKKEFDNTKEVKPVEKVED